MSWRSHVLVALVSLLCCPPSSWADHPAPLNPTVERDLHGWTVEVDDRLLSGSEEEIALGERTLTLLEAMLVEVAIIVPEDRLQRLRDVVIRVDKDYGDWRHMVYHPSREWLIDNGHSPELARRVHIQSAELYSSKRHHSIQPHSILHELAHAYHHQVLGFDDGRVLELYRDAKTSGKYALVRHIGGKSRRHYALQDHKEYFAECTECYLATNDFYPFVRAELREHDPEMFGFLEEIWGAL